MVWDVDRYFEGMKRVYHGAARGEERAHYVPFKLNKMPKGDFINTCPFCNTTFKGKQKNNECPFCGREF